MNNVQQQQHKAAYITKLTNNKTNSNNTMINESSMIKYIFLKSYSKILSKLDLSSSNISMSLITKKKKKSKSLSNKL